MGSGRLLALFLILLVLGFEAQGSPVSNSSTLLSQMHESLFGYWNATKTVAEELYHRLPTRSIWDVYNKSTTAATTYTEIFTDQLFNMLTGDQ